LSAAEEGDSSGVGWAVLGEQERVRANPTKMMQTKPRLIGAVATKKRQ
jgi:hypothetical protein